MTIRGALVGLVLALGLVVVAPSVPAWATPAPVSTASAAFWQLHDAANTNISLQANDDASHTPPGPLAKSSSVFLFVTQFFCDSSANQAVFRSILVNNAPIKPGDYKALPNFKSASLRTTVPANVAEQRSDGCSSNPSGGTTTSTPTIVSISADWTGSGPVVQSGQNRFTRGATATGSLSGFGSLGTATFASITQSS